MSAQRRVIAGRYELAEIIAAGGMGTVYRARDRQLERDVAVKLMRPEFGEQPGFAQRFALEARRTARFSHPNIVAIHDYGGDKGAQFIVMELVAGQNLAQLITRLGALTPERAVRIAADVAAALQVAHRHGIVHRDVKPANILITPDGAVKLTDLGIAQAADDGQITTAGQALGTVDYLSPEQVRGEPAGPTTDIYALGIVLYEMLTGRRPFRGESAGAIALKRLTAEAPDPRSVRPDLPASLAAIVRRCLARQTSQRYRSARGVGLALRRWLSRQGQSAPMSVPTERQATAEPSAAVPAADDPGVAERAAAAARQRNDPRAARRWLLPAILLLFLAAGFAGQRLLAGLADRGESGVLTGTLESSGGAAPSRIPVGSPGGVAVPVTPEPVTPEPPTPVPATPAPTPPPATAAPATPAPPTPAPPPPTPTSPVVAPASAMSPSDTVARFYGLVAEGRFDRAQALWSQRMKSTYPRQENLDQRFDDTASITIHRLDPLHQDGQYAVVGVEFTERYESGAWRRFDGSWELVRVDGRWLLDAPQF